MTTNAKGMQNSSLALRGVGSSNVHTPVMTSPPVLPTSVNDADDVVPVAMVTITEKFLGFLRYKVFFFFYRNYFVPSATFIGQSCRRLTPSIPCPPLVSGCLHSVVDSFCLPSAVLKDLHQVH